MFPALWQQKGFNMRRLLPFLTLTAFLAASSVVLAETEIHIVSAS
jgi:hypothetical protein